MNDVQRNDVQRTDANDERLLDRLVDGELADDERRALLLKLDTQPDGWRRCALRFLESQCLDGVFGEMSAEAQAAEQPAAEPRLARPRGAGWWISSAGSYLAMAATVLVAFLIGIAGRDAYMRIRDRGGSPVMAIDRANDPVTFAGNTPSGTPWGSLKMVVDGGQDAPRQIEVPVVEHQSGSMFPYLSGGEPAIPPEVEREFRQYGHTVERERRFVPFDLDDGRRVIVPVDEVEVRPGASRAFQ